MADKRQFGSDNHAGICPEAWEALEQANSGHAVGYGDDEWTARAADLIRDTFETPCEVFFVFNGTSANALALACLGQSYHSVICSEAAHVETDECGAPEFFSNGMKVIGIGGESGKLTPAAIEQAATRRSDVHYPKPRAVSLTQATELGTVYSPAELRAIADSARRLGLRVHMDGARFANAVASLEVAPREISWQAGVDVLSFGGTKNGLAMGEAVVFFDRQLAHEFDYRRKQGGQLASKMRFLAAPWVGLLRDGAWLRHARHANAMAALLHDQLVPVPGVRILHPRQANAVFVEMSDGLADAMRSRGWRFYDFFGGSRRLMCSWDTTAEDVRAFASDLREIAAAH